MAKTKFEEMFDRLPSNIKETEILRLPTKKVLAALLELLLHSEARESRVIFAPNPRLRKLSGISSNDLLPSIEQLIDYDLITRKVGTVRKEGKKSEASQYTINIKKLKEPLVEKTFDDLFSQFCEEPQSLEKPKKAPTLKEQYLKQLESPLWIKKRNMILERDHHQCVLCGSKYNLQVHHKRYSDGKRAWEYPNAALVTLCRDCHQKVHADKNHDLSPYKKEDIN